MEVYETDDLSDKLWSYFRRRRYLDGNFITSQKLSISPEEMALAANIEKDTSHLNAVSFTTVISDFSQAEVQFSMFKSWVLELDEEVCKDELSPMLMPLLCHIYLESIRTTQRHTAVKFLKRFLVPPLISEDWCPFVESLLDLHSFQDIDSQPNIRVFRSSKYELKLSPRTMLLLKKFLTSKSLHILIQIIKAWFEVETLTEDVANFEEDSKPVKTILDPSQPQPPQPTETKVGDNEDDEDDEDDYIDVNDSDMEQLVQEIQKMRSQPTPPPPLLLYTAHRTEGIVCGRVSSDGKLAATGDHNSEVRVWGLGETKLMPKLHPSYFNDPKISAYTEHLYDQDEQNNKQWWSLRGHCDTVYDVAFLSDSDYLISVSFDTTMRLWKMNDFSCAAVYRGHSCPVWGAAVSPVQNFVATASSDKTARIWSLDRTFPLRILAGHLTDVLCVAFHPNGSYVATGSLDRTVRLWSVTDGSLVRVFGGHHDQGSVHTIAFSPNGQYAASAGSDHFVWLWDLASGSLIYQLGGHTSRIVSVDWSHDGSTVSAGSYDGTVLLWSLDCDVTSAEAKKSPRKYFTKCSTLLSLQYSTKNALVAVGLA